MDLATATDIRVLGLDPEQAERIREGMPDISIVDIAAGVGEASRLYHLSFGVGIAATSAMFEETAYRIVKAVMEDKTVQATPASVRARIWHR
ncbi:TAXI family TRAP transporter solute-binding subunit [Salipiger sp.]|uniref:TAXI family TRAP transporter solute-binding subunit n=1 Tax=Salipiger sp. TaxID=2078585 RepID=UPI003A96AF4C